jgi:hypothetical protein
MSIDRLTSSDFADNIAQGIRDRDKTLDVQIGPIRDLFIDPISEVLENQNDRIVYLNKLFSLQNANAVVPDDLDDLVFNDNVVRWDGAASYVVLTFSRILAPVSDLTVPLNFPVSSQEDPLTGATIVFRTIETKTMYAAAASSYYNATTKRYELNVAASSISSGFNAQVGAYTITTMRRPLSYFDTVTNKDKSSGGKGTESNAELAERYSLHITGSQIATPMGIKSFILDNVSNIEDVYVVYGSNAYLTRESEDAGAVDIWVLGDSPLSATYVTTYAGLYTVQAVDFQPIMSVTTVSSVATGLTYVEGVDYEVVMGEGIYSYSNLARDGIRWLDGGDHPAFGEDVIIQYTYNGMMNILTAFFNQPLYYSMGSDKLFRWAQPTYLTIDANLKVKSGSPSVVYGLVRTAILGYINGLKLGESVEEFDLDAAVGRIYGVDNWTYNQLSIKDGAGVGDIDISPNTYARLETSDFVINLV